MVDFAQVNLPVGGDIITTEFTMTNRSGGAVIAGAVVQCSVAVTAEATAAGDTDQFRGPYGVSGQFVAVGSAKHGIFGVCKTACADNANCTVTIIGGVVDTFVVKASGSVVKGDPLVVVVGADELDGTAADDEKVVAYALEAVATPGAAPGKAIKVLMDGWSGFGMF